MKNIASHIFILLFTLTGSSSVYTQKVTYHHYFISRRTNNATISLLESEGRLYRYLYQLIRDSIGLWRQSQMVSPQFCSARESAGIIRKVDLRIGDLQGKESSVYNGKNIWEGLGMIHTTSNRKSKRQDKSGSSLERLSAKANKAMAKIDVFLTRTTAGKIVRFAIDRKVKITIPLNGKKHRNNEEIPGVKQ